MPFPNGVPTTAEVRGGAQAVELGGLAGNPSSVGEAVELFHATGLDVGGRELRQGALRVRPGWVERKVEVSSQEQGRRMAGLAEVVVKYPLAVVRREVERMDAVGSRIGTPGASDL